MALPQPVGRQKEVLYLPGEGHVVVLGTAGSGKTTLAILRAGHLADAKNPYAGRTLLLTFNNALVAYLRSQKDPRMRAVNVETYHKFARGYLASRGLMGPAAILAKRERRQALISAAVTQVSQEFPGRKLWSRPLTLFEDEIAWISSHGVRNAQEYEAAERIGRAEARITRQDRPFVYHVVERYRSLRRAAGRLYDWDDMAMAVCDALDCDESPRRYRHVVIDEGQDFSPEMLRSLAKAVGPSGSITLFGDVAQQIYGRRISWRDAGLNVSQGIWQFEENYRNSLEIASLALSITAMPGFQDAPDLVSPKAPAAAGPKPTLVEFSTNEEEIRFVATQAKKASEQGSVVIVVRSWDQATPFLSLLRESRAVRIHRDMAAWSDGPGLRYATYHSVKGLEFDTVFLPNLSDDKMPDAEWVRDYGQEEADANDIRLLYVGVTRARTNLIMSYTGEVTHLLPTDSGLYTRLRR